MPKLLKRLFCRHSFMPWGNAQVFGVTLFGHQGTLRVEQRECLRCDKVQTRSHGTHQATAD